MATSSIPLAERKPARTLLDDPGVAVLAAQVPRWEVVRVAGRPPFLGRKIGFRDFAAALGFANRVGALADALDHHPELHVSWGKLGIEISTHDAGGLSEADFVLAARIDRALADDPGRTTTG